MREIFILSIKLNHKKAGPRTQAPREEFNAKMKIYRHDTRTCTELENIE